MSEDLTFFIFAATSAFPDLADFFSILLKSTKHSMAAELRSSKDFVFSYRRNSEGRNGLVHQG